MRWPVRVERLGRPRRHQEGAGGQIRADQFHGAPVDAEENATGRSLGAGLTAEPGEQLVDARYERGPPGVTAEHHVEGEGQRPAPVKNHSGPRPPTQAPAQDGRGGSPQGSAPGGMPGPGEEAASRGSPARTRRGPPGCRRLPSAWSHHHRSPPSRAGGRRSRTGRPACATASPHRNGPPYEDPALETGRERSPRSHGRSERGHPQLGPSRLAHRRSGRPVVPAAGGLKIVGRDEG